MTSKSIQEVADLIANSSPDEAKAIMDAHPTKIMVFGQHIPDYLLLMGAKMNDEEYRALVAAGPAVVMVAKEDMLKLLERLIIAEQKLSCFPWYTASLSATTINPRETNEACH
ncbi:MAG: hypothetical protein ACK5PR_00225 [bacterium]